MKLATMFPTTVGEFSLENPEELNKGLAKYIYDLRLQETEKDIPQYSMGGPSGYHSSGDILQWDKERLPWRDKYITEFHEQISNHIQAYYNISFGKLDKKHAKLWSWAMIYGRGDFSILHSHGNSLISSVYCVKIPDNMIMDKQPNNISPGTFHAVDPRSTAKIALNKTRHPVLLEEGQGLIFPGWLEHFVTPHNIDDDRICITTNMRIFNNGTKDATGNQYAYF